MAATTIDEINEQPTTKYIFIVGGGIVGASLAFYLSECQTEYRVVVVDRSQSTLLGSTGHAPGFVGQLNEIPVLTKLAIDSVNEYSSIPGGFSRIGGLEIASTSAGAELLSKRQKLAQAAGLPAELVDSKAATNLAPEFIKADKVKSALHFPADGTADPKAIVTHYRKKAEEKGAVFLEVSVSKLEARDGSVETILTSAGRLETHSNPVVLATGIWTRAIVEDILRRTPIPIVPVAHPYTFTGPRPRRQGKPYPFIRWPEEHVYARDHGDCDGFGTYHHTPMDVYRLSDSAIGVWPKSFESALAYSAKECLKNSDAFLTATEPDTSNASAGSQPYNGIFAVTPDNVPLAGKLDESTNIWLCAAVWITSAAGTTKLLARQLLQDLGCEDGCGLSQDDGVVRALDPNRFKGGDVEALKQLALSRYNDIYNSQQATA